MSIDGQKLFVQTLEFYYQNCRQKDHYYEMVTQYLKKN
ncbi:hypothetical protein lbkm_2394 [Lachnospiraceae bacterium KM106-2]|nr:hypothetical protein lbkm_2394 [Lachnospiraceae bacterium KM106-2]